MQVIALDYNVATIKEGNIIPKQNSAKPCALFLRRGGSVYCTVTGGRRYSSDLPQGGLDYLVVEAEKDMPRSQVTYKKSIIKCTC